VTNKSGDHMDTTNTIEMFLCESAASLSATYALTTTVDGHFILNDNDRRCRRSQMASM